MKKAVFVFTLVQGAKFTNLGHVCNHLLGYFSTEDLTLWVGTWVVSLSAVRNCRKPVLHNCLNCDIGVYSAFLCYKKFKGVLEKTNFVPICNVTCP